MKLKCSDDELMIAVEECVSFGDLCRKLKLPDNGNYFGLLRENIERLNLSINHFVKHKNVRTRPRVKKICPVCGKAFTDVLYADKKRHRTVCSKACANTYFRSGENHPNWKEPDQRTNKRRIYREICFSIYKKKCILCDWDIAVDVHHLDEDEENNGEDNLVPLCANHHRMAHMNEHKENIKKEIAELLKLCQNLNEKQKIEQN